MAALPETDPARRMTELENEINVLVGILDQKQHELDRLEPRSARSKNLLTEHTQLDRERKRLERQRQLAKGDPVVPVVRNRARSRSRSRGGGKGQTRRRR